MSLSEAELAVAKALAKEELKVEEIERAKIAYKEWLKRPLFERLFPFQIIFKIKRRKPNV